MVSTEVYTLMEMCKATNNPASLKSTAYALRLAKQEGCYDEILAHAKSVRHAWLIWLTLTQRSWMTKVSRRPDRGVHHDSWAIREKYTTLRGV